MPVAFARDIRPPPNFQQTETRKRRCTQERAGPAQLADSKRYWKIEKQEGDLTGQLGELEQGTRQRNREFEAKLRAIEERIRG